MKKTWNEPKILVQQFVPNEYVAACGDSGTVYNFECNAGNENGEYTVKDSRGNYFRVAGHTVNGHDWYYHPCSKTHTAESDSGFVTGYHIDNLNTREDENIPVVIWTNNNTDIHCTTKLDMSTWETAKS